MTKGKYSRSGSYRKTKFKKSLFFVLFSLIILCIIFNILNYNTENTASSGDESESTILAEETTEPEPVVIEPSEDEDLETLIKYEMSEYGFNENNFSFFYYNIDEKKYYFYNEDWYFTAASTVKVPIAMYYYDEINAGDYTLQSTLLYEQGDYEAGGGSTASLYSVGDYVPLGFLLEQTIINSDNTAVNILIGNLGYSNTRRAITKYSDETVPEEFYSTNIASAGFYYDVINYLYENQDSYQELIENMKQSSMGMYLKEYITDYDVAHKYGSYNGYVHDYGIVYGEETYLVGIFTKNITNSAEVIAQISLDILNYTLGELDVSTLIIPESETSTETNQSTGSNEITNSNTM